MLICWKVAASGVFLLLIIGCTTPLAPNADVTSAGDGPSSPFITDPRLRLLSTLTNAVAEARSPTNAPAPQRLPTNTVVAVTNAPPPPRLIAPRLNIPNGWVLWEKWNTDRWSKPERLRASGVFTFELKSSKGLLDITAGQRTAHWNGVNLELGFAPRLTNGQPAVHSLDLAKTFEPLLTHPALLEKSNRTVVIDPGHGGENLGAKSILSSHYEKEFALDWALRLAPLLKARGWKVVLTRTKDVDLSLAERVAVADAAQADLFISLHFNSSDQPQGRSDRGGLESYCLTPVGMPSTLTRHFDDELHHSYPNNLFDLENFYFAIRLQHELVDTTQRPDRGVRRARFMGVLRGQNRPAVLLEGGYLTHPGEAEVIANGPYRQKLAEAVAKALSAESRDQ